MAKHRIAIASALVAAALALGCASGVGESQVWKRPCGTDAQREADSQACLSEVAGLADPSSSRGMEYGQDMFRDCMEARGWQRLPKGTALECK